MNTVEPGIIAGIIMASVFLNLITMAYTAHRYIDTVESHLSNCQFVNDYKRLYAGDDLRSKVQRLWMAALVLSTPSLLIRRKLVDPQDLKNFPAELKVRILAAWMIGMLAMTASVIFYFWTKYL
ncbi:hypothetical protein ALP47_02324 [Pseudomonas savastanoi]|uniref:hypothetical protein n=1 Tax=Pseudomonas syringae group TaxID=136849 RepID=UPI000C080208|nr:MULTISPECIES: hypothetical protein [Pseudomonas syringae group]PHN75494.1 hypothetical protein AO272_13620 [Pseudomonas syringae pv. cerasicola]PHN75801.1 hypothetical protein AO252_14185 [Pseudomonas syringae pv. cerasicola]RMT56207.1 hypothetical protein ALP47_02324 [Pseudomonas savastanoi]SPF17111.1 hypothetical protein PSCFBP6110_04656 [Pseudomonas syringae pv. cerasicola]